MIMTASFLITVCLHPLSHISLSPFFSPKLPPSIVCQLSLFLSLSLSLSLYLSLFLNVLDVLSRRFLADRSARSAAIETRESSPHSRALSRSPDVSRSRIAVKLGRPVVRRRQEHSPFVPRTTKPRRTVQAHRVDPGSPPSTIPSTSHATYRISDSYIRTQPHIHNHISLPSSRATYRSITISLVRIQEW